MKTVIDIETVPRPGIMDTWYPSWAASHNKGETPEEQEHQACLYPEFGMVCAVALHVVGTDTRFSMVAANEDGERELLYELGSYLDNNNALVGHNIKGFDIPFLAKRYLAHKLPLPQALRLGGKKPWGVPHLDTMELMKFGGWTPMSLRSACLLLNIGDPKSEGDGSKVWEMFKAGKLDEIRKYCVSDVDHEEALYKALVEGGAV